MQTSCEPFSALSALLLRRVSWRLQVWGVLCSNIEGALDDPGRKFRCLAPRTDERMHRPKEVWKYDLHTLQYMREELHLTMRPEHAADAMAIWLQVLHENMCKPLDVSRLLSSFLFTRFYRMLSSSHSAAVLPL